jgi:hypothetical protein
MGTIMTREELLALRTRRAAARAQLDQLTIRRAQRGGEFEKRWAEHRALQAAIFRTCRDFERVMTSAAATKAEKSHLEFTPDLNGDGWRSRARLASPIPLRRLLVAQSQASYGVRASQL